jgi:hypothetical protein
MKGVSKRSTFGKLAYGVGGILLALSVAKVAYGQLPGIRDTDDQIKYNRGQNIVPVFEGWVPNPDGTFGLVFGSWNRNWEETVLVPIGPDNHIDPGGPDRGQPTVFYPRRGKNHFEITVPKDFGDKEVVWTITSRGKTEKAFGKLVKEEVLTRHMVLTGGSLNAAADAGNDDAGNEKDPNKAPMVTIEPIQLVTLPGTATATATVTDDGIGGRGGRGPRGVRIDWTLYRGPSIATFKPSRNDLTPTGGKGTTTVSFTSAGSYTIRAKATDSGGMETNKDIVVNVK